MIRGGGLIVYILVDARVHDYKGSLFLPRLIPTPVANYVNICQVLLDHILGDAGFMILRGFLPRGSRQDHGHDSYPVRTRMKGSAVYMARAGI